MTTPTPSVCLITCPVCGSEGATSNEATINKELFRLRRDLAAAQEARELAQADAKHAWTLYSDEKKARERAEERATEAESMVAAIEDYNCESDGCLLGSDEAFKVAQRYRTTMHEMRERAKRAEERAAACELVAKGKLWLWKNFVDGRPEYWAFDNPFPINLDNGDPQTLGDPCGYALFKPSRVGRTDVSDEEVLRRIDAAIAARTK